MSQTSQKSWYQEGLSFSCTACGHCCGGGQPGYVWVSENEVKDLAKASGLSLQEFYKTKTRTIKDKVSLIEKPNFDCIFLQDGHCSVYTARPLQCRTFPFWTKIMESKRSFVKATCDCPGMDQGRFWSEKDIQEQLGIEK